MDKIVAAKEYRADYMSRKEEVLNLLEEAIGFYLIEDNKLADALKKLKSDLQDGEFSIVVVGEFSAGKSTLLNALMGRRILPSWTNETTATVNILRHEEKAINGEKGAIFYRDGKIIELPEVSLESLQKYVSTKGEQVAGSVEHVDLYLNSDFLKDGVTLVDSPGLNGTAEGHREITEAQILKSHASIFIFSSDHPGTKTDFEFLHDLQKKVKTIIFVLNKIDEINPEEKITVENIIDTLKRNYKTQFPNETEIPEIWPVSARDALYARDPNAYNIQESDDELKIRENTSRLEDFENRLTKFLTCGEKTQQQLIAPVDRIISLLKDSKSNAEIEKQTLEQAFDAGEIQNQISDVKISIEKINQQMSDSNTQIYSAIKEGMRDIKEELSADLVRLNDSKHKEIDTVESIDELDDYLSRFENAYLQKVYSLAFNCEESLRQKFIEIIRLKYASASAEIEQNQSINNSSISVSISTHLENEEEIFEVGLQELNQKLHVAEKELEEKKKMAHKAEEDSLKEKAKQKAIEKIEIEIKNLEAGKEALEMQMLPPVERYTEERRSKISRGGILGTVGDILFGKKNVVEYVQIKDTSERDVAKEEKDRQIKEKEDRIAEKKKERDSNKDIDIISAESRKNKLMEEVEESRQELLRLRKENIDIIDKKTKSRIRNIKRKLDTYCDTIAQEVKKQVTSELRRLESNYVNAIVETVGANLKKHLEEKSDRLRQLEKQLSASEVEKNERIAELQKKIDDIEIIMNKSADIMVTLKNMEVDEIGSVLLEEE